MNKKYIDFVPSSRKSSGMRRKPSAQRRVVTAKEERMVVTLPDTTYVSRRGIFRAAEVRGGVADSDSGIKTGDGAAGVWGDDEKVEYQKRRVRDRKKVDDNESATKRVTIKANENNFSIKGSPKLGVVEDYNPKFVNKDVPKRPLHNEAVSYATITDASRASIEKKNQDELTKAKSQRVKKGLLGKKKNMNEGAVATKAAKSTASTNAITNSNKVKTNGVGESLRVATPKTASHSPFINQEKVIKRPLSKNVYQRPDSSTRETPKGPVTIISTSEKDSKIGLLVTIILTIILGAAAGTIAFLLLPK